MIHPTVTRRKSDDDIVPVYQMTAETRDDLIKEQYTRAAVRLTLFERIWRQNSSLEGDGIEELRTVVRLFDEGMARQLYSDLGDYLALIDQSWTPARVEAEWAKAIDEGIIAPIAEGRQAGMYALPDGGAWDLGDPIGVHHILRYRAEHETSTEETDNAQGN